jgi:hypothetical protein
MLNRPLDLIICLMTGIALATIGSHVAAKPECRDVHGRLDSVAADLDGKPDTLETVGTLRGGIHADLEFRGFTPVPVSLPPAFPFLFNAIRLPLRIPCGMAVS